MWGECVGWLEVVRSRAIKIIWGRRWWGSPGNMLLSFQQHLVNSKSKLQGLTAVLSCVLSVKLISNHCCQVTCITHVISSLLSFPTLLLNLFLHLPQADPGGEGVDGAESRGDRESCGQCEPGGPQPGPSASPRSLHHRLSHCLLTSQLFPPQWTLLP